MRISTALLAAIFAASAPAYAQSCTGLACQQVSCPGGGTTSISGTIYAPNGTDPLPNVLVFVPNDPTPLPAFPPGVACVLPGSTPPGSPLVGTTTAVDGTFTIANVPVGASIPLVVQTGRWRRQAVINTATAGACNNTAADPNATRMPRNHIEGDIPLFAVATGSADQVECVLRKVGIADSEFTDPGGSGRINLYSASNSPGEVIDAATPSANVLMGNAATLNSYDVLMLPCEGGQYAKPAGELSNLVGFANAGGRVYSSHYSYAWMYQNPPFSSVAQWSPKLQSSITPDPGTATVDTSFSEGNTLAQWLQEVGATTAPGQMTIATLRQDQTGVIPPTQSWLTLNNTGNPVMQFVFDTPVGQTNQCGRVLYNEYHVETSSGASGATFPNECSSASAPMTPQEKLLEYSLFELTADGNAATLTPTSQDFGTGPINFPLPTQTFVWTNNSIFPATVTLLTGSPDFTVGPNNCKNVPSQTSCQITVSFTPTVVGGEAGALTVGAPGTTLSSALTGAGTSGLSIVTTSMQFPNVDVGGSRTQMMVLTNTAPGSVPVPSLTTTGDYRASTTCANPIPINSSCTISIIFAPTVTGLRTGTLMIGPASYGLVTTLTGNGVDFSISMDPASGGVVAGYGQTTFVTTTPIAGFNRFVTLSCAMNVDGSTCTVSQLHFILSAETTSSVVITTTSKYTVIGYGGVGGSGWLWLIAVGSACLLWMKRRKSNLARAGVMMLLLAAAFSFTGCSGKLPAENDPYTVPGTATYTLTATDQIISHSATYTLNVTIK